MVRVELKIDQIDSWDAGQILQRLDIVYLHISFWHFFSYNTFLFIDSTVKVNSIRRFYHKFNSECKFHYKIVFIISIHACNCSFCMKFRWKPELLKKTCTMTEGVPYNSSAPPEWESYLPDFHHDVLLTKPSRMEKNAPILKDENKDFHDLSMDFLAEQKKKSKIKNIRIKHHEKVDNFVVRVLFQVFLI